MVKGKIYSKWCSERGASVSVALLLFLICTVICSVIMVAATTASGRLAAIAETDQRYYSVTSAASLLKSLLDGKTVSLVEIETRSMTTTYTNGRAGTPVPNGDSQKTLYLIEKSEEDITDEDLVDGNLISTQVDYSHFSMIKDAAYRHTQKEGGDKQFELSSNKFNDAFAADITEALDEKGNIFLTVKNQEKIGKPYSLMLSFLVDESKYVEEDIEDGQRTGDGASYTIQSIVTKTTTTTMTWSLSNIKTITSEVSP